MALEFEKQKQVSSGGNTQSIENARPLASELETTTWQPRDGLLPETARWTGWTATLQDYFNQAVERCKLLLESSPVINWRVNRICETLLGPAEARRFGDYSKGYPDPIKLIERVCGSDIHSLVKDMVQADVELFKRDAYLLKGGHKVNWQHEQHQ